MADIEMPQLGETVTEGTITQWFKQVGDTVAADEPLFEVSTDKVDSEVPSPVAGTVTEILVSEGDTVAVGTVLARVGDGSAVAASPPATAGQPSPSPAREEPASPVPPPTPASAPTPAPMPAPTFNPARALQPPATAGTGAGRLLSPVVRRLINEHGLDPSSIVGTGAGGRISRNDVQRVIEGGGADQSPAPQPVEAQPAAPPPVEPQPAPAGPAAAALQPEVRAGERDTAVPHSRIRRATADHMVASKSTAAHVYCTIEVDFDRVEQVRRAHKEAFKAQEGTSLTYLPFIARAVVDAISGFPEVNASFTPDDLVIHHDVHLGVAVDLDFEGLLVPVVKDAGQKRLRAISREIADLAGRARSKSLQPDDLSGGTFTITNPGPFGTTMTLPILNQSQVAILSTDAVKRRPVVVEAADGGEAIAIRPIGFLTLTWDHRAFDGAYAASFLARTKELLESMDWEQELG